ncbi:MAG: YqgE/AlgH family protein [Flavobacteriaceae bacterium]|nr:YqgE/AlgH family protein [Flavobacteriaceae bacterium]MDG2500380.1 YqgE/AlgH family protein [Flavobacteriaceae bacterium]
MKGKILISSPNLLSDMIFYKSIILIIDKTEDGLTGLILNRHSDLFITKDIKSTKKVKIDLYYGGPVSNNHFYLLKSENDHLESIKIDENLYWGNNIEYIFDQIEDGLIDEQDVILFQGYSGWEKGQLDDEIENNSWIVLNNQLENVFNYKQKNSWNKIIKNLGKKYRIWSNSPDDITLN